MVLMATVKIETFFGSALESPWSSLYSELGVACCMLMRPLTFFCMLLRTAPQDWSIKGCEQNAKAAFNRLCFYATHLQAVILRICASLTCVGCEQNVALSGVDPWVDPQWILRGSNANSVDPTILTPVKIGGSSETTSPLYNIRGVASVESASRAVDSHPRCPR